MDQFDSYRAAMNEKLLGSGHLGLKRFFALDTQAYEDGALDKKTKALDAFFTTDGTTGGYRTLREAYLDITGHRPRFLDEDLNRKILRDSYGAGYDSAVRSSES
ncbi:MAG: hypothetical protein ABR594_18440, partial [Pyrinomonadaceae bacterium]